jgi:hypothetical protein
LSKKTRLSSLRVGWRNPSFAVVLCRDVAAAADCVKRLLAEYAAFAAISAVSAIAAVPRSFGSLLRGLCAPG